MSNEELLQHINSDATAVEKLLLNNKGLVIMLAKKFLNRGYDMEELIQLGNIGLFKAIKNFDPSRQIKFSTYAVPLIMGEIKQALRDNSPVKVSRNYKTLYMKIMSLKEHILKTCGYEPSISELAKKLNVSYDQIVIALDALTPPQYIYQTIDNGTCETFIVDQLASNEYDIIDNVIDKILLHDAISKLSPIDKKILYLRFIRGLTQCQIAKILDTSQVKISRKIKKFLQQNNLQ
ncbi:MAG: sigma-70 family RNA polymerase sigma factor [Clostridiales bacterium]|nr:sigma-70 family RNA polymerase sigma factor [Clostridiales bacterium]